MAKESFPLYTDEWLGGTVGMSLEEKGGYIELLILQFKTGHFTTEKAVLIMPNFMRILCQNPCKKFVKDRAGLWYNRRMDLIKKEIREAEKIKEKESIKEREYKKGEEIKEDTYLFKKEELEQTTIRNPNKQRLIIPPQIEWVKVYCDGRKNGIDAQSFIDFYTSKGWMIGKNRMKDWEAAVRTWERGDKNKYTFGKQEISKLTVRQQIAEDEKRRKNL